MSFASPVTQNLDDLGIPYRVFRHPGTVNSLEQAARERGQRPGQVVRSILFRLAEGQFVLVLMAGPVQVSWPRLRSYLGQSRLTTASEAEVLAATGYPVGAVSPLGLPGSMRVLVDRSVLEEEEVSVGSGERNVTVVLQRADLLNAVAEILGGYEVGEFGNGG
ncbi:MAG TPA: YbaK/EbsC family protein [Anaerolineales bacterium]|nr:YbaK/EbsC family protein [Anaerolineales bacterium]